MEDAPGGVASPKDLTHLATKREVWKINSAVETL